ncbi:MAG: DMT family transporter [Gammaproteobacteria bacterium]|nr:DMT family transporter [Gammaproteobacteria bacterium]
MNPAPRDAINRPRHAAGGIGFILLGMLAISINDMLIKWLSGDYPLHQMVFIRSAIGICFSLVIVHFEGGWQILKPRRPWLHVLRGLLIVTSNMTYFAALAVLPLAEATALFFVAPLFITLLSIPVLREKVGVFRLSAVAVGFVGVLIMQRPWQSADELDVDRLILVLPLISALTYACNQILTRHLGVQAKASAMAIYIQASFIVVSLGFLLIAGDGRYAVGVDNPSLVFLLRAWTLPTDQDAWLFAALGFNSAIIGYSLAQAYRLADAATVAPFEYAGLPLAILWGWLVWNELPVAEVWIGICLIVAAGLFVFFRERVRRRPVNTREQVHRRY